MHAPRAMYRRCPIVCSCVLALAACHASEGGPPAASSSPAPAPPATLPAPAPRPPASPTAAPAAATRAWTEDELERFVDQQLLAYDARSGVVAYLANEIAEHDRIQVEFRDVAHPGRAIDAVVLGSTTEYPLKTNRAAVVRALAGFEPLVVEPFQRGKVDVGGIAVTFRRGKLSATIDGKVSSKSFPPGTMTDTTARIAGKLPSSSKVAVLLVEEGDAVTMTWLEVLPPP